MDIVIIAQYIGNLEELEHSNGRFTYLANLLTRKHKVEIVTSTFLHGQKKQAEIIPDKYGNTKLTALYEPGYSKNVCLKRILSHKRLAGNVKKYLYERKKPDVVYVAVPSLSVAEVVKKYCEKNSIRLIVDIQDLWPEAFEMVFNVPILSKLIFKYMEEKANKIYSAADELIAVSKTYVERGMKVNKKCKQGCTVFRGTNLETFDKNVETYCPLIKKEEECWLAYCGTLGSSYNLPVVFKSLNIIKKRGGTPPKFIVMGDGPRRKEFETYAKKLSVSTEFTGKLPYETMCAVLAQCDIVINPIAKKSAASIINKHADYAASGLALINTQESLEYRKLVEEYQMGFNCDNDNEKDIAEKIERLCKDKELREKMGDNARKCAEEQFDRRNSYMRIVNIIEGRNE